MEYPYLGKKYVNEKPYVVMFTGENEGTVVANETDSDEIRFGMHGDFEEDDFELLPPEECVRLSN